MVKGKASTARWLADADSLLAFRDQELALQLKGLSHWTRVANEQVDSRGGEVGQIGHRHFPRIR